MKEEYKLPNGTAKIEKTDDNKIKFTAHKVNEKAGQTNLMTEVMDREKLKNALEMHRQNVMNSMEKVKELSKEVDEHEKKIGKITPGFKQFINHMEKYGALRKIEDAEQKLKNQRESLKGNKIWSEIMQDALKVLDDEANSVPSSEDD